VAVVILYPAIDLKGGQCVRLLHGDMDKATVFNADPAAQARAFVEAGARWLHIVDLDGAVAGKPVNAEAVKTILASVDVPVQLGGGIRDRDAIARWLNAGVARVILGTIALRDPDLVKAACREFPGRVAVGIDARRGKVAVEGWVETSDITALDLARRFKDVGVAAIIHTDIDHDGVQQGPNLMETARLARNIPSVPVIASGGITWINDINAAKKYGVIAGVVIGRALYEGRFALADALKAAEG
jgi:phosphoribosylformimino-5-aminoimidazole carboxamide ribotide isomerase